MYNPLIDAVPVPFVAPVFVEAAEVPGNQKKPLYRLGAFVDTDMDCNAEGRVEGYSYIASRYPGVVTQAWDTPVLTG